MMQDMRWGLFIVLFLLAACATNHLVQPPVQEMAAARSAITMAKGLPDGGAKSVAALKTAEQALAEAAHSIDIQHYIMARRLAIKARKEAQRAAKFKQQGQ